MLTTTKNTIDIATWLHKYKIPKKPSTAESAAVVTPVVTQTKTAQKHRDPVHKPRDPTPKRVEKSREQAVEARGKKVVVKLVGMHKLLNKRHFATNTKLEYLPYEIDEDTAKLNPYIPEELYSCPQCKCLIKKAEIDNHLDAHFRTNQLLRSMGSLLQKPVYIAST